MLVTQKKWCDFKRNWQFNAETLLPLVCGYLPVTFCDVTLKSMKYNLQLNRRHKESPADDRKHKKVTTLICDITITWSWIISLKWLAHDWSQSVIHESWQCTTVILLLHSAFTKCFAHTFSNFGVTFSYKVHYLVA